MEDTSLQALPSLQTTWGYWRSAHPDTRVAVYEGTEGRPYLYRGPDRRATSDHDTSALGLGLVVGGEAWIFPLEELGRLSRSELPLVRRIGGEEVRIHYAAEGLTAWAENAAGERLVGVIAYESGWRRFYPDTRVFRAGGDAPSRSLAPVSLVSPISSCHQATLSRHVNLPSVTPASTAA